MSRFLVRHIDYGLRSYKVSPVLWPDGWTGHLGAEPTPAQFVAHLVDVFRDVRRVLRDDGLCFVNLGDSYASQGGAHGGRDDNQTGVGAKRTHEAGGGDQLQRSAPSGLKALDLMGIPWAVAFALRDDGWYLRSAITWAKQNTMPESVTGWRWEQHRVKVSNGRVPRHGIERGNGHVDESNVSERDDGAKYIDCPGCPDCLPHGGLILRRGNWRPTKATEMIFMFSKTASYYADREAVLEPLAEASIARNQTGWNGNEDRGYINGPQNHLSDYTGSEACKAATGRNMWDYWLMSTQSYKGAHYATFPQELPRKCILAATSARGVCPTCGSQWARIVKTENDTKLKEGGKLAAVKADGNRNDGNMRMGDPTHTTLGWLPTCSCDAGEPIPATVLDIFSGSGTTVQVATDLGRRGIGLDLSPEYHDLAKERSPLLMCN